MFTCEEALAAGAQLGYPVLLRPSYVLGGQNMILSLIHIFIEYELPGMKKLGPAVLANLGGSTIETYEEGARLLDETNVDFIELNIS